MSIQINNNFDYKGNQPNFERDRFETLELMCSADERSFDNGHISYCIETGKHYVFNENNAIDVKTGKWRLLIENNYDDTQVNNDIADLDANKQDKTDNTLDTTDKTVVGAINEINGNTLDNVTFSADYKNIIINRKNGLNPYTIPIASIINNAKIIELNDVDSTDIGNGKTLVYDGTTQKHKYVSSIGTDELVKMDSTTDAKHLSDLIDKQTIVNDNGILKVKKLDGQNVTIAEINYLKGLTMNVMDLVNAFANGGIKVLNTPVNTHADLSTLDRTQFIDGISYIVYVLADETHSGAKTTYLCDKTSETFFGNADSQRNFTVNPLDLASEVTGKLPQANMDLTGIVKTTDLADYMNKAAYDTNSNGIVDKAETLEGLNKTVNDLNNSLSKDDIIQGDNIEIIKNPNGSITISSTATGGDTKIEKFTYTDEEVTENLKGIWE